MTRPTTVHGGFTLVELMVGSAMGAIVMAALLSTYGFLGRNMARLSSYQALENESRKAMAYLCRDFTLAQSVKSGSLPSASVLTLVLPAGEVSYTYDSAQQLLRREATFGTNGSLTLLNTSSCRCATFSFGFYTTTDGAPTDQATAATYIPYSIKQIDVRYVIQSPTTWSATTQTKYEAASGRYVLHNRGAPDGT